MTGGQSALAQPAGHEGTQDIMEKFRLQQLEASQKTYDKYYQKMLKRLRPYFEDPARGKPPFYDFIKAYRNRDRFIFPLFRFLRPDFDQSSPAPQLLSRASVDRRRHWSQRRSWL
jgi:hypothetical protein